MRAICSFGVHFTANTNYRPLDTLLSFHMEKSVSGAVPVRYAVRQVMDQELKKEKLLQNSLARQARSVASEIKRSIDTDPDKENHNPNTQVKELVRKEMGTKRDFFGRIVNESRPQFAGNSAKGQMSTANGNTKNEGRIWVSFHEGFSNAVRKPITLKELMEGF